METVVAPKRSRLPWKRRRQELEAAKTGNAALWDVIVNAHLEMNRLDRRWERQGTLSLPDRIALYALEQRLQQKADQLGKPVVGPCNRCGAEEGTFHNHTVHPRELAADG